jgi:hypothetical protein
MDPEQNLSEHKFLHDRLERIELKMDRLVEAVTNMARLEERLGSLLVQNERIDVEYHALEKRVQSLEQNVTANRVSTGWTERFIWQTLGLVGAAMVGALTVYWQAKEAINPGSMFHPFTHEHHSHEEREP